jgi:hypothetical protein
MLGKILLEFVPRARKLVAQSTPKWPSENQASERKRFNVTRGRTSSRIKIDLFDVCPRQNFLVSG